MVSSYSLRIGFTENLESHFMALAAFWTHDNVTELESHSSVTKTPRGWGAEFSFPESGTVNSQRFENRRRSGSLFSGPVVAGRAVSNALD
jgi:hypothetical protein